VVAAGARTRAQGGEATDVMVKLVNGEVHGMFILEVAPKELTIVLILGPVRMEDWANSRAWAGWERWATSKKAPKRRIRRRRSMRRFWIVPWRFLRC